MAKKETEKKEPEYRIFEYLKLEHPGIDPYIRAYTERAYCDILKTREEWKKTLEGHIK